MFQAPSYKQAQAHSNWLLLEYPNFKLSIDIGANIGSSAISLSVNSDRVIAIEPHPCNFESLLMNTSEYDNIDCINMALGESDRTARILNEDINSGLAHISDVGEEVQMKTLDSLGLKPDFIKIDVEGYELQVLQGAVETLKHKPIIQMERYDRPNKSYGKEAGKFLLSLGYKAVSVQHPDVLYAPLP